MKPTVVLVGRPNVGKSTLFNRLTKSRAAIVADIPGLTRDRHFGHGKVNDKPFLVVDTGGLEPEAKKDVFAEMAKQTLQAIAEADVIIFIVDARQGLTPQDQQIAEGLRKSNRHPIVAVNKAEGLRTEVVKAEFFELGLGEPWAISAAHGEGVADLISIALEKFPEEEAEPEKNYPKFAVVGRPNVGKSTLVNTILGEERVIAFNEPGTTRDSIYIDFERNNQPYTIIDTAGVRKRGKVWEALEKFSVIKTLQSIEDANVVLLVLDASQDVSEQDAHLAGFILESGRALVVAINKWDAAEKDRRELIKLEISRKLRFLSFARFHYISALEGSGVGDLFRSIDEAYKAAMAKLSTPALTRLLITAAAQHQPPQIGPHRPKLRYAHQGGMNPPLIVIHGTALLSLPETYRRYLENTFRTALNLRGTPLAIQFKQGQNPFAGRKPAPLTEREEKKLHRQRRHGRKKYG